MTNDGGLEEHVERETAQAVHHQRWFIRQHVGVRLLVAVAISVLLTCLAAAMYFGLTKFSGESIGSGFWVPLAVCGALFMAVAIVVAVDPVRYVRGNARAMGMFPTRAPGYGSWVRRDSSRSPRRGHSPGNEPPGS